MVLPITQDSLNYMCRGNDTDVRKFIGVLHAIRAVPPKAVQIKIKYAIRVIIDHHHHQNHHNLHCSNFHFPHIHHG